MKKDRDNWKHMAPDALLGYSVIALCILCFMLFLAAVVAVVRFFTGTGTV